jgi:hypothetical protein
MVYFLTYIIYVIAKINIKDFHKLRAWCLFVNETTFTLYKNIVYAQFIVLHD